MAAGAGRRSPQRQEGEAGQPPRACARGRRVGAGGHPERERRSHATRIMASGAKRSKEKAGNKRSRHGGRARLAFVRTRQWRAPARERRPRSRAGGRRRHGSLGMGPLRCSAGTFGKPQPMQGKHGSSAPGTTRGIVARWRHAPFDRLVSVLHDPRHRCPLPRPWTRSGADGEREPDLGA
jgi:hypothetical protein